MAKPTSGYGEMPMWTEEQYLAQQQTMLDQERVRLRVELKEKFNVPDGFEDRAVDIWLDGKYD